MVASVKNQRMESEKRSPMFRSVSSSVVASLVVSLVVCGEGSMALVRDDRMVAVLVRRVRHFLGTAVGKLDVVTALCHVTFPILLVAKVGPSIRVPYTVLESVVSGLLRKTIIVMALRLGETCQCWLFDKIKITAQSVMKGRSFFSGGIKKSVSLRYGGRKLLNEAILKIQLRPS